MALQSEDFLLVERVIIQDNLEIHLLGLGLLIGSIIVWYYDLFQWCAGSGGAKRRIVSRYGVRRRLE
jgi:hypothetical protein